MIRCVVFLVLASCIGNACAGPVEVRILPDGGLQRDGKPFFIKGAGGQDHLDELAKRGGNSTRTWGEREIADTLVEAEKRSLTVCAGIWLEPECNWFSYNNAEHCTKQVERVRKIVQQHRAHPALILWGLGNETEGDGKNIAFWKQLDHPAIPYVEDEENDTPRRVVARGFWVFNVAQVSGYQITEYAPLPEAERITRAEQFYAKLGIDTRFGGDEAYFGTCGHSPAERRTDKLWSIGVAEARYAARPGVAWQDPPGCRARERI